MSTGSKRKFDGISPGGAAGQSAFATVARRQASPSEDESTDSEVELGLKQAEPGNHAASSEEEVDVKETWSSWEPSNDNITNQPDDTVLVHIKHKETITLVGLYSLEVVSGKVCINGAVLEPNQRKVNVFAPATHALPQIECVTRTPASVKISRNNCSIRELSKVSAHFEKIWNEPCTPYRNFVAHSIDGSDFTFIKDNTQGPRYMRLLQIPQSWHTFVSQLPFVEKRPPRILVLGKRYTGKSTFCSFVTNHLLTSNATTFSKAAQKTVCWIDMDPSQSEFNHQGQVSLVQIKEPILGPSFTHSFNTSSSPYRPIWSHPRGSPKVDNVEHFQYCFKDLQNRFERLQEQFPDSPLVINMPGCHFREMYKEKISLLLLPHCRSLTSIVALKDFDLPCDANDLRQAAGNTPLHIIDVEHNVPSLSKRAEDFRQMQQISYFQSFSYTGDIMKWSGVSINQQPSWTLKYEADNPDVLAFGRSHTSGAFYPSIAIMRKACLAVCALEDDEQVAIAVKDVRTNGKNKAPYLKENEERPFTQLSIKPRLLGFACGFLLDQKKGLIHLKTPITQYDRDSAMKRSRDGHPRIILLKNDLHDFPAWVYLQDDALVREDPPMDEHEKGQWNHPYPWWWVPDFEKGGRGMMTTRGSMGKYTTFK